MVDDETAASIEPFGRYEEGDATADVTHAMCLLMDETFWRRPERPRRVEASDRDLTDGSRLPYDVIAVVAEILAYDVGGHVGINESKGSLQALAALNLASRAVHDATLPFLYQKTILIDEKKFARSISKKPPKGWRYTRYLYLTHRTLPLLRQFHRFLCDNSTPSDDIDVDMSALFPRLVLLCATSDTSYDIQTYRPGYNVSTQDLQVELYRPVPLDVLHDLCLPVQGVYGDQVVSLFGVRLLVTTPADQRRSAFNIRYMFRLKEVVIRKGGGVLPATHPERINGEGTGVRLHPHAEIVMKIMDPLPDTATQPTIDFILQFARMNRLRYPLCDQGTYRGALHLNCSSAILDCFTQRLDSGRIPSMTLKFYLDGKRTTKRILQQHLKAIAEACSRNWNYDSTRGQEEAFIEVHGELAASPALVQKLDWGTQEITVAMMGYLYAGSPRYSGRPGFSSHMETNVKITGEREEIDEEVDSVNLEVYPCAHVPIPEFSDSEDEDWDDA